MSGLEQFAVKRPDCCDSCPPEKSVACVLICHRCWPHGERYERCDICEPCPDRADPAAFVVERITPFRSGLDLYNEQTAGSKQ